MADPAKSPSLTPITVREAVIDLLRAFRMTTVFGNPGSTELPLFRDFPADFRYVLGLQESVAVGMADGFAQAVQNAAFVNLHGAVGVGHALGNIFTAYRNQTPLVITAGQQARSLLPFEPFLYAEQPAEFPRPYVKWSCQPARAEDVPGAIARAYYMAMQPPRGPTFVSIPVDDWERNARSCRSAHGEHDNRRRSGIARCRGACARGCRAARLRGRRRGGARQRMVRCHRARRAASGPRVGEPDVGPQCFSGKPSSVRGLPAGASAQARRGARRTRRHPGARRACLHLSRRRRRAVDSGRRGARPACRRPIGGRVDAAGNLHRHGNPPWRAASSGRTAAAPARRAGADAAAAASVRRKFHRCVSVAADRGIASAAQHHRRRGTLQPRCNAPLPSHRRRARVPYLCQRRIGPRPSGRGRRRARPKGTPRDRGDRRRLGDVFHPGAVVRRATGAADDVRDCQERRLRGHAHLRAPFRYSANGRHAVAQPRFLWARRGAGCRGRARDQCRRTRYARSRPPSKRPGPCWSRPRFARPDRRSRGSDGARQAANRRSPPTGVHDESGPVVPAR